jgi:hypothetical protein
MSIVTMMESHRLQRLIDIIQTVSDELGVFVARGQGAGNRVTNSALARINERVLTELGPGVTQRLLCNGNRQAVDFYLRDEGTIVELEFSLTNPYPCLEKDLFKALLAKDAGADVRRLVLIGDPGSRKRLNAPAPRAIMAFVERAHGLAVTVVELQPHPALPENGSS